MYFVWIQRPVFEQALEHRNSNLAFLFSVNLLRFWVERWLRVFEFWLLLYQRPCIAELVNSFLKKPDMCNKIR